MAYQKQTWENLPSTNTPVSAERLNHMEDGIAEAWEHGGGGAGETLPVGSEIDFDGESTDIPTGWEQVEGKTYLGTVLYNDTTGTTGSVTLSDSSANYNYMEIYFRTNDGLGYTGCQKVYNPDAKKTCLIYWHLSSGTYSYVKVKGISISGTSITNNLYSEISISNSVSSTSTNNIYITRVVGYKEV